MSDFFIPLDDHAHQWHWVELALKHRRLPQALMFIGSKQTRVATFVRRLVSIILCHNECASSLDKPHSCMNCKSCHLLKSDTHPDLQWITLEATGGVIKIDQIRLLQEEAYQTPICSRHKIIVIEPADKMNLAASNALLKVLEEPPSSVYFMLIAEQITTLPATILSRCQKVIFPCPQLHLFHDVDGLDSSRAKIGEQTVEMLTSLCDMIEDKISLCALSSMWSSFEFNDLIEWLYWITAQVIQIQFTQTFLPDQEPYRRLSTLMPTVGLFKQLDRLKAISKKLSHNISMNTLLTLDTLLLGYKVE